MPDAPNQPELAFATTEELVNELLRRHSAALFAGIPLVENEHTYIILTKGNLLTIYGMAGELRRSITRRMDAAREH